jgi:hypothetical protein
MRARRLFTFAWRSVAVGAAATAAGYLGWVALAWSRYGHAAPASGKAADPLLDQFMPVYDVVERHAVAVSASPAITFAAAADADLEHSRIVRAIFRTRAAVLGASDAEASLPRGLLAKTQALGWGVLATVPEREVVMGAVTQPWLADVVFRALPPAQFAAFDEPGFVKIVWTLRADPDGDRGSIFRTETRVIATDPAARSRFRWYWARFSPGIAVIRRLMLGPVKAEAERRARQAA